MSKFEQHRQKETRTAPNIGRKCNSNTRAYWVYYKSRFTIKSSSLLIYNNWLFSDEFRGHSWTYGCTMRLLGRVRIRQSRVKLGKLFFQVFINFKTFVCTET